MVIQGTDLEHLVKLPRPLKRFRKYGQSRTTGFDIPESVKEKCF